MSDTVRDLAAEWLANRDGLGEPSESEAMDLIRIGLRRAAEIAWAQYRDLAVYAYYRSAGHAIAAAIEAEIAKERT